MNGGDQVIEGDRDLAADAFRHSLTPIAVCSLQDGSIMLGNASCLRTIGRSAATPGHLWSPGDVDAVRELLAETGEIPEIVIDVDHPERGTRRLMATVAALDVDGETCAVVAFLDTTERRQYRRVLREFQKEMNAFLDNVPAVIALRQIDGRLRWANRRAMEQFGLADMDREHVSAFDVVTAPTAQRLVDIDNEVVSTGRTIEEDLELPMADGELHHFHLVKFPLRDGDDNIYAIGSVANDITEQVEANREAERANRAKSDFLSRMSHELRTPLNAILGFGELLRLDDLDVLQRDNADHIVEAGRHLLDLIDEVLDITRIESGLLRLSLEPVALSDLIREVTRLVGPVAERAAIRLTVETVDPAVHVRADRMRLRQVLLNLLSNGIKYNAPGGRVVVSFEVTEQGRARVVVADTGQGISANSMSRLFQPFERLGAESSLVQGTGLGLALARQLMTLMHGTIGAHSEAGVGSRFWIELARDDTRAGLVEPGALDTTSAPPIADAAPASKTVLLVEDNMSNVKLVEQIMRLRPHVELVVAMTGGAAIEAVAAQTPDLVLLDLHLPDTSGQALLTRLKTDPRTAEIPVVIVSADATEAQQRVALELGASDYLTKPIDVARFLRVVDRY